MTRPDVFIVDACRTPIGAIGQSLAGVRPDDLAAIVIKAIVARTGVDPARIEDVVFGCANQAGEDNRNVARMATLLAGLPTTVPAVTVNRLCASGLTAVNLAARAIRAGEGEVFVAGGVESMTRAPYSVPKNPQPYGPPGNVTAWDTALGWRYPNPRLEALFRRSFPRAAVHGGGKTDPSDWLEACGPVDFQVPIGSLPRRFRGDRTAFPGVYPYLRADAGRVEYWHTRLRANGTGPAIGISWRGGTAASRSKVRSVPPELVGRMLPRNVAWVSLQHGPGDGPPSLPGLRTFPGVTGDLDELAALLGALDLVVSVANTNVHLAGALGRPVWLALGYAPDWRWLRDGADSPWYPTMRIFRQTEMGDWNDVFADILVALHKLVRARGGNEI